MSMKLARRALALGAVAVAALSAIPVAAGAPINRDMQTTNVPYLAWRGEHVRIVKCLTDAEIRQLGFTDIDIRDLTQFGWNLMPVEADVVTWSGDADDKARPKIWNTSGRVFRAPSQGEDADPPANQDRMCASVVVSSNASGLAMIKMTASKDGRTAIVHDFLVGWMDIVGPTVTEIASGDPAAPLPVADPNAGNPDPQIGEDQVRMAIRRGSEPGPNGMIGHGNPGLGDPSGDGHFTAGNQDWNHGRIRVVVKGRLPLEGQFGPGLPAKVTMPDDWAMLAGALARDADESNMNLPMRWDIHDDTTLRPDATVNNVLGKERGVNGLPAANLPLAGADGIPDGDLVYNADTVGVFTYVVDPANLFLAPYVNSAPPFTPLVAAGLREPQGGSFAETVGPFDPQRSSETLLPDAKLDWGDAPMPAARIIAFIRPNNPLDARDVNGIGSLGADEDSVFKYEAYSQSHEPYTNITGGAPDRATGDLYAPFYEQYIPATKRPLAEASGTTGEMNNNGGDYLLDLRRDRGRYPNWRAVSLIENQAIDTSCLARVWDHQVAWRQTPQGPAKIALFTDEHGEAILKFRPGTGFYWNNLRDKAGKLVASDRNPACDLGNVDVLGRAVIQVNAEYPFQTIYDPHSATITKTVHNGFAKTLSYYPKAAAENVDQPNVRIVVAHAVDIDGSPLSRELVCWSAGRQAEALTPFKGIMTLSNNHVLNYFPDGNPSTEDPNRGVNRLCTFTDRFGYTAIEVLNSDKEIVDVMAEFVEERLFRDIHVDFTKPGSSSGGEVENPPSTQPKPTTPPPAPPAVPGRKLCIVRLINVKGKRMVAVLVMGPKGSTAKVRVTFVGRRGNRLGAKVRVVRTNKLVRIKGVYVPKRAKRVVVRLAS